MSIGIIGESLIDMIPLDNGTLQPLVGGSPFNVARAVGRLQSPSVYLAPLSKDRFGDLLYETLVHDNVQISSSTRSSKPTSLAVVSKNKAGQPAYSLYREGVADRDFSVETILAKMPHDLTVIHTGSLAIVPADIEKIRQILLNARERGITVSVDINTRPGVVDNTQNYINAVKSIIPLCDIIKASDEDLEFLGLKGSPEQLCEQLMSAMNGGVSAVTLGSEGAIAFNGSDFVRHPGFKLDQVTDTVGAGDCFQAGILTSLYESGCLNSTALQALPETRIAEALHQGCACAALNVMRQGCNPPTKEELITFLNTVSPLTSN